MEFHANDVHHAVELLRRRAVVHGSALRITESPAGILEADGMEHDAAVALAAHLEHSGLLVARQNGNGPYVELLADAVATIPRRRIAVFIDLENVQKHLQPLRDVISIERIEAELRALGDVHVVYAFLDVTRGPHEVVNDLDRSDVVIVHCKKRSGHGGALEDTVDERLKKQVQKMLAHADITAIAIAANDNGYIDVFHEVRRQRREAILLIAEPEVSGDLQRAADRVIPIGSQFMRDVAHFVRDLDQLQPMDDAGIARCATQHRGAFDALAEIVRHAALIGRPFAPQFLRDRIQGNPRAQLPHVATIEEMLRCVFLLVEFRCLMRASEETTRLKLDRTHPFVRAVIGDASGDTTDDDGDEDPESAMRGASTRA